MFFLLSKIITPFIKPICWIFLALIIAIVKKKWRIKFIWVAVLLTFIFGNKFLVNKVLSNYEYKIVQLNEQDTFDYAIVLGGYSRNRLSNGRLEFNEAGDRLIAALDLLRTNKCKKVLLTGGDGSIYNIGISESKEVFIYLKENGYSKNDFIIESQSKNTYENALNCAQILPKNSKILLITSAFHMKRAKGCFDKLGVKTTPFSVDYLTEGNGKVSPDNLLVPDGLAFEKWEILLKEWVGLLAYKMSGKI